MGQLIVDIIIGAVLIPFLAWLAVNVVDIKVGLARVEAEHQNNGGKSTKDAIDRIEHKLDTHIDWHMERTA